MMGFSSATEVHMEAARINANRSSIVGSSPSWRRSGYWERSHSVHLDGELMTVLLRCGSPPMVGGSRITGSPIHSRTEYRTRHARAGADSSPCIFMRRAPRGGPPARPAEAIGPLAGGLCRTLKRTPENYPAC